MQLIYKRTTKAEIMLENGQVNLPFNIRNLLNFIDGHATILELQDLLGTPNVSALLKSLKSLGLVEEMQKSENLSLKINDSVPNVVKENAINYLDKYRSIKSDNASFDSKFSAIQNNNSQTSETKTGLQINNPSYEQAVSIAMDLLRNSNDANAFELMFALEKLSSPSQLKAILPSIVRLVSNNPNAQQSVQKILSLIE